MLLDVGVLLERDGPERGGLLRRGGGGGLLGAAAAQARGADDLGLGGGALGGVDDVGDDDGHVVRGAGAQGEGDEAVGGLTGVVRPAQDLLDRVVRDEAAQAVGAEHVPVAAAGLANAEVGLVARLAGEDAGDDRALRVGRGLVLGDPALVDEGLDEGVVLRDLLEASLAQEVGARVADVGEDELVARSQQGGDGRAHAEQLGLAVDDPPDPRVGLVDDAVEGVARLAAGEGVTVDGRHCGDRGRAREVTAGVAAHPVGDDEQVGAGVSGVLVVGADETDV